MNSEFFADLDDFRWEELDSAYGDASRVPTILRELSSTDGAVVANAFGTLYDFLYHQEVSLSEATAAAIPFLARLACERSCIGRARIAYFIGDIAGACQQLAPDPPTDDDIDDILYEENVKARVAEAVQFVQRDLSRLLFDDDLNVRCVSPFTLAQIVRARDVVGGGSGEQPGPSEMVAVMAERMPNEMSPRVRASLGCAILWLSAQESLRRVLETLILPFCKTDMERLSYRIVLGQRNVGLTDDEVRSLAEAYKNPKHTIDMFGGASMVDPSSEVVFPWFITSAGARIGELILKEPYLTRSDVVDALCVEVATSDRLTASLCVCPIIEAYLGDRPLAESDEVSYPRKNGLLRVLNEVAKNDDLWQDTYGLNLSGVVQRLLGIEDSEKGRHDLQQFIERLSRSAALQLPNEPT